MTQSGTLFAPLRLIKPGECLLNLKDAERRSGDDLNLFLLRGRQKAEEEAAAAALAAAVLAELADRFELRCWLGVSMTAVVTMTSSLLRCAALRRPPRQRRED